MMREFAKTTRALIEIVGALSFRGEPNVGNAGNRHYRLLELKSWLCIVFITACLLTAVSAQAQEPNEVLILASYHPTMGWTKSVVSTIESELLQSGTDVEIHTEYMDTKHFSDRNHYTNLYTLFKNKAKREQYDVIITVDNNALLFLLRYRDELYPNVPIVFCGIDQYHGSMYERRPSKTTIEEILGGHDLVTGVLEEFDYERTIEVALQLHPSTRRVILINDGINEVTYYPNLSEEDVTNLAERFAGRAEFENLLLTESNLDQVIEKIRQCRRDSIVLLTNTFLDIEANLSLLRGKFPTFCWRCDAPVYAVDGSLLELGHLMGGYINSGYAQGKTAADMALQILTGESPGNIPIITKSPNMYIFQYPQMKRFGISPADLPPGSVILNQPESFYYKYKGRIWTVVAIIVALALMVVILSINILRRKAAEENLRIRNIAVESSINAIAFADMNGELTDVNSSFLRMWGYSNEKQVLGKPVVKFWTDESKAGQVSEMIKSRGSWIGELTAKRKDGSTFDSEVSASLVKDEAGKPACIMASFIDITEHKQAEEKLEQYRFMVESAHDAIFFKDLESRYVIANNKALEAFGLSREQVIGKNDIEIMPNKEEARKNIEDDKLVFKTGKPTETTKHMTGVDGEERWFQAIKVPQFDDKGNVVGLIGIARDISQHKRTEEAIRKSEERYRALFESTGTANMVLSAGGVFLMMNELAARYLRGTPKDLVGKSIHDFFPKEACNEYLRRFHDVVDSGEGKTYEDLVELSTGNRWFLTNMHPVEDTAGNMTCVQLISQDITERKRAEEVLRQSEERLRLALSAADMGTWRWDPVINQDTRDASFNRILGLSAAESTQPVEDFLRRVHPDDRDMVDKEIQCAIRDRQPYLAEFRIVRPDGAIRWLRDQGKVLCDEDDRVSYMTGAVVDITEHRRTEEALRESEQRFRSLVEASSDWVWEVDRNGIYTYASPKVKDLLGYELEEIIGKTPFDLMPPDEAKRVAKLFNGIVESRKPFDRLENTNLHKDGRLVVLETSGVPILGERKNLLGYRGIDRDITERKRAREELQKAYDELETRVEQRTADLANAVEKLQNEITERERAQQQLRYLARELTLAEERLRRRIATDVHDHIGQNLAISKIKLESLRGSISSPELATSLDEIRELIAQTIESSRSLTFELSPPVLYELGFEAAVEWLVRRAREQQGLSTDFKTDGRPKPLGHDVRVLLFQAVRELLLNVAKHANARNVTVWSRRVADEIQVAVEDDGVGFDTSKTTSRDYETGGFGLFSIRERLRSIGGRFDIESKPGAGTRVTLAAHVDNGNEDSGEKRK